MHTNTSPKISVLMAYYNNIKYVEESIVSVCSQTYKNWELIVVDDCSPDEKAKALIASLQEKYGFILISSVVNQGASKAFQKAFEASTGEYISIISHDDLYVERKLEHSLGLIQSKGLDALYCNGAIISDDKKKGVPFDSSDVKMAWSQGGQKGVAALISSRDTVGSLLTQGALYKRKVFDELFWIREKFLLDDWPFTIKVWRDYKVEYDDSVVYLYRHHENNTHKNFWRWLPARVQTVSELVEDQEKLEVLSFLLINLAEFSLQNSKKDDAMRFALAGLMMANSSENIDNATRILRGMKDKSVFLKGSNKKMSLVLFQSGFLYLFYRFFLKFFIGLVPIKRVRKRMRGFFRV